MFNRCWGPDRRKFQRLKISIGVWYKVESPWQLSNLEDGHEIEATTVDICEAGMGLLTKYPIPVDSVLILKFMLFRTNKDGVVSFNNFEITGKVCSCAYADMNKVRLGVAFISARHEDRNEIADFVVSASRP